MTASAALGVAVVALGMVLTPGPNVMYLVSRSITQGRRAGMVSLAGIITGNVLYFLAATAGLSLLFAAVPPLFVSLKLAGAAYLLWVAAGMLRRGPRVHRAADAPAGHSPRRRYLMGLTTCVLNPKVAVLYGALLPQFVRPVSGPTARQLLELGAVQIGVAASVNALWVLLADRIAVLLERSRRAERSVRWTTAGLLACFALHIGTACTAG